MVTKEKIATEGLSGRICCFGDWHETTFYYGFYLEKANVYAFTDKRILQHRGWLSTRTITIDYHMITDVQVIEPFFQRVFTRTGSLSVDTASSSKMHHEVTFADVDSSYELKKRLAEAVISTNIMIILRIGLFCILTLGIILIAANNLNRWAAALRRGYDRDIKRVFGDGWFSTPSLFACKIHVIFLVVLSLLIVFNLCVGTIYL